jgi:Arc/MetJ-type ribon-helix-helix transcriptional regulator
MGRTSVTLDDETEAILDAEVAPNGPYESRSEAVRECIREYAQLHRRIEDLETENERLHRERRQLLEQREEHTALVRTVERDQTLQERRAQASIFQKAKWAITGMPSED